MKFREIREIKEEEKLSNKKKEEDAFKQIKPKTNITVDEAKNYFDNLFKSMEEA